MNLDRTTAMEFQACAFGVPHLRFTVPHTTPEVKIKRKGGDVQTSIAVKYGLYEDLANLAGLSIQEVREKYQNQWNMSTEAIALVNGKEEVKEVSDSYIIQDGDRVEFAKSYTICASNEEWKEKR